MSDGQRIGGDLLEQVPAQRVEFVQGHYSMIERTGYAVKPAQNRR